MDNKSVILPKWIDKIIFDDFEAVYEPCPMEVVYNPDQPYEFVKLYLGTYFPRSFAEAYSIISSLMTNDKYKQSLYNLRQSSQFKTSKYKCVRCKSGCNIIFISSYGVDGKSTRIQT